MKVVHLSVVRHLTSGQAKQLACEVEAAGKLRNVAWSTVALQTTPPEHHFSRRIPILFRPMFLRNLFGWITALHLSRQHDYLVMRHMTFDPFALIFAPLIRNRISVHHAKEADELLLVSGGWKGRAAAWLEGLTGRIAVRHACMIAGVTPEIAEYERVRHAPSKPTAVYANGLIPAPDGVLADRRGQGSIRAAFICGTFADWQGLDKLVAAVDAAGDDVAHFKIYLIGGLSEAQAQTVAATPARAKAFVNCGFMSEAEYRPILETCDIGIGSLALERANLVQAATLKVREMLAMGLPVYSTHEDGSLPRDFRYYLNDDGVVVRNMVGFANRHRRVGRKEVCEAASPYISKESEMKKLVASMRALGPAG